MSCNAVNAINFTVKNSIVSRFKFQVYRICVTNRRSYSWKAQSLMTNCKILFPVWITSCNDRNAAWNMKLLLFGLKIPRQMQEQLLRYSILAPPPMWMTPLHSSPHPQDTQNIHSIWTHFTKCCSVGSVRPNLEMVIADVWKYIQQW